MRTLWICCGGAVSLLLAAAQLAAAPATKTTPAITWPNPAAIAYGTALSSTQLNAKANVTGKFVYTPAAGTVLKAGIHTLSVKFTPTDTVKYTTAAKSVSLTVNKAKPVLTWPAPAPINYGTALSATQLNAKSNVAGTFKYNPVSGTILKAGTWTLSATFTPTDGVNYTTATKNVTLVVGKSKPVISRISPVMVVPKHSGFTMTVSGSGFVTGATVRVGANNRTTTFVSSAKLIVSIPAADVATVKNLAISVLNPDAVVSNPSTLIVNTTAPVGKVAAGSIASTVYGDGFGSQLAYLGDITGDGKCPRAIAISARYVVYVVCDYTKIASNFTMLQVGTSVLPGFKLVNSGTVSYVVPWAVSGGADIDGDGINDFVVGVSAWQPSSAMTNPGTIFVVKGGPYLLSRAVFDLNDAQGLKLGWPFVKVQGTAAEEYVGESLPDSLADLSGDGHADVVFPAAGYNSQLGAVMVLKGRSDFFNSKILDLSKLGTSALPGQIYTLHPGTGMGGYFGSLGTLSTQIQVVPDLNGDGLPDIVIGDPIWITTKPFVKKTFVVFGSNSSGTFYMQDIGKAFRGATFSTNENGCKQTVGVCIEEFGASVTGYGGRVVVSDQAAVLNGGNMSGMAYVYDRKLNNAEVVDVSQTLANGTASALFGSSDTYFQRFGYVVKDGPDYLLIGAVWDGSDSQGRFVVVSPGRLPTGVSTEKQVDRIEVVGDKAEDMLGYDVFILPDGGMLIEAGGAYAKFYYLPKGTFLL